jgi:nucleoside-diphosphate-sugar epimerase
MKRALVTGGAGFVGRHMTARLLTDGWAVQTVDLKPLDIDYLAPYGLQSFAHEHWEGDIREWFMLNVGRYDLIVHCAAVVGGRATINGDPLSVADNLGIDAALFQWAVATRQPRIVYYSSSAAYPVDIQSAHADWYRRAVTPKGMAESEINLRDALRIGRPDAIYGWSKLTGEILAEHARAAGVAVHVLRPFSGYGEDQDLVYPFRAFIERAKKREDPFRIWGTGRQVRDWVHIDDVIGATLAVIDADYQEPVNVCTGRGVSMRELASMILKEQAPVGPWPQLQSQPDMPDGPCQYRVGDPTRLKTIYKPQISIEQGIRRAFQA